MTCAGLFFLHYPDEAGAEHAGGRAEEGLAQRFDGAEGGVEVFFERFGYGGGGAGLLSEVLD